MRKRKEEARGLNRQGRHWTRREGPLLRESYPEMVNRQPAPCDAGKSPQAEIGERSRHKHSMIVADIYRQVEEFAAIIEKIPGAACHSSSAGSDYYTLPTGHILRLSDHPSVDFAGQSADIYVNPSGTRNRITAQFVLRTLIGYDRQKRKNVYFKRKVDPSNLLPTLVTACTLRKPIAHNPYVS